MVQSIGSLQRYPARASFFWYASTIIVGAVLLMQPFCGSDPNRAISALDALFTATSATCVTGLAVRSTGNDFSWWGQLVILVLIQIGGIGIMTVTTFVTFQLGARQGIRQRALIQETLGMGEGTSIRRVLARVIRLTALVEGMGALLLWIRFLFDDPRQPVTAAWEAVFHSISAFCNAGFSLHDDSLMRYQKDWWVNGVVMALIITGGIGFPVIVDLLRSRRGSWAERWDGLLLHTKIMLVGTGSLLLFGTVMMLVLEWEGALRELTVPQAVLAASFHSTTCRTAGFNTLDVGSLTDAALFISILLMAIGAGPCSAAGGFKVSTLSILVLRSWRTFLGYSNVTVARRTIPDAAADRALAAAMVFGAVAILSLTALLAVEARGAGHGSGALVDTAFETVSALGTVGLSTGMTPRLGGLGSLMVIGLMFIGRLGPITFFVALSHDQRRQTLEFAAEEPLTG